MKKNAANTTCKKARNTRRRNFTVPFAVCFMTGVLLCGCGAKEVTGSWEEGYENAVTAEAKKKPGSSCGYYLAYLDDTSKPPYLLIELEGEPGMPFYRVVTPNGQRMTINHGSIAGYDSAELLGISGSFVKIKYTNSRVPGSSNIVEYEVRGGTLSIHSQFENGDESVKEQGLSEKQTV